MIAYIIGSVIFLNIWNELAPSILAASIIPVSIPIMPAIRTIVVLPNHIKQFIKAINTPVEERGWLGDPDEGLCPRCDSALIYKGDKHWDGFEFPFECAVCGAGGGLVNDENGEYKFVLAENGLIRDRNVNAARAEHLNEIIKTRIDFFEHMDVVQQKYGKYKELKFPAI